ncbi:MAG: hypothetical protein AAF438_09670 [Pseudomonadota bacterium]
MIKNRLPSTYEFVSRQLSFLVESGHQTDSALRELRSKLDSTYSSDIDQLEALIRGSDAPTSRWRNNDLLEKLTQVARSSAGSVPKLIVLFEAYFRGLTPLLRSYWSGLQGMVFYGLVVMLVATMVVSIYKVFVLPGFDDFYSTLGGELPEFTRVVLGFSDIGVLILGVVVLVSILFFVFCMLVMRRRLSQFRPLPTWLFQFPILGHLARTYNQGMQLNVARILIGSGVDNNVALESSAKMTGVTVPREVFASDSLGNIHSELEHQCELQLGVQTNAMIRARDRLSVLMKSLLSTVLGALIIAMYLPIFKMGSVV